MQLLQDLGVFVGLVTFRITVDDLMRARVVDPFCIVCKRDAVQEPPFAGGHGPF